MSEMTTTSTTGVTLDDLMQYGEDEWVEVVDGEIVKERDMAAASVVHIFVNENVGRILRAYVREHKNGYVFGDGLMYVLSTVAETIRASRIPDLSFIRRENFKRDIDFNKPYPGAPDLAVEVVSPNESAKDLQAKIDDYLAVGTEQVWVLYPDQQTVHLYQHGTNTVHIYREDESFTSEALFPGLTIPVAALFTMDDE